MNHHEFIHRNIKSKLISDGFNEKVANSAASYGVSLYNKLDGKRTRKGNIFDDVYMDSKVYAKSIKKSH